MEEWEYSTSAFVEKMGIVVDSPMAEALYALSENELRQLKAVFDPEEDILIHVDSSGFSINHGNVGTQGIGYDFK